MIVSSVVIKHRSLVHRAVVVARFNKWPDPRLLFSVGHHFFNKTDRSGVVAGIEVRRAGRGDIADGVRLRWETGVQRGVNEAGEQEGYRREAAALHDCLERWIDDEQGRVFVEVEEGSWKRVALAPRWRWPVLARHGWLAQWQGHVASVYTIPGYLQ